MPTLVMPHRAHAGGEDGGPALADARESLAYWERRAATLPRWAVRRRREARELAARWRARVAEAEQARYGRGLVGALAMLAAEGRLPERARRCARVTARRVAWAAAAVAALALTALAAAAAVAVEVLAGLLDVLG